MCRSWPKATIPSNHAGIGLRRRVHGDLSVWSRDMVLRVEPEPFALFSPEVADVLVTGIHGPLPREHQGAYRDCAASRTTAITCGALTDRGPRGCAWRPFRPAFPSSSQHEPLNRKGSRLLDVPERFGEASTALSGEALDRGCTGRSVILHLTPGALLRPASWLADGRRGASPISGRSESRRRVECGQDLRARIRAVPVFGDRTVHRCVIGSGREVTS
jgi:hypothetical protein